MANYHRLARAYARKRGLDPNIVERQVGAESSFNPNAVSPTGAVGLDQLEPATARSLGVRNSRNPRQNLAGGTKYLRQLLDQFHGNYRKALAAYNAGPGNYQAGLGYADKILNGQTPHSSSPTTGPTTKTVTTPGKDNSGQRNAELLDYLLNQSGHDTRGTALLSTVTSIAKLKDTAPTTKTVRVSGSSTASGGAQFSSGTYPLGRHGKLIGTPYQGTHAKAFNVSGGSDNWQSENAVDIAVPTGTPVYAVENGTLGNTGSLGSGGRFAGLRTNLIGRGNSFYYAHLSKLAPGIRAGAHVRKGQLLGYSGAANGVSHLHFAAERGDPRRAL